MTAYYNENDLYAAEWLKELIMYGAIAPGVVDTRSIEDVTPNDLKGFSQHHFFAGIGGWSFALRLAGWPDDRAVWTGSCPCQPFSTAGKGEGFADERHLWPAWLHLLSQRRPPVVFGEQVASRGALEWFDLVSADLEVEKYAWAARDTCAASVGAPHIRQRLIWVAYAITVGSQAGARNQSIQHCSFEYQRQGDTEWLGDDDDEGLERRGLHSERPNQRSPRPPSVVGGFWRDADWLYCRDGKYRPVEPGTFPLAHGVSNRVGRLRAYGNAIVPQVCAEMISDFMEYESARSMR